MGQSVYLKYKVYSSPSSLLVSLSVDQGDIGNRGDQGHTGPQGPPVRYRLQSIFFVCSLSL